jgi:hypothetical protein
MGSQSTDGHMVNFSFPANQDFLSSCVQHNFTNEEDPGVSTTESVPVIGN